MIAEFSVFPVGKGAHLGKYVAPMISIIEESGLEHVTTAMGTIVEGKSSEVFELIRRCHEAMAADSERVITSVKIDDFVGRQGRLQGKLESLETQLGRSIRR